MATIVKDLGAVTAYAYAKEKGYTGTEDEFAELMASYADVAEQAAESAAQAGSSATAAEQAKAEAVLSASAAASSASTASTKASEAASSASSAAGSANTATTKANEASTSATNAASSASAAATSATNAGASETAAASSATAASNAQTAAETAQGKAEDAQTAAEDAAASISASAAQITQNAEDVADLKSAIDLETVNASTNLIDNRGMAGKTPAELFGFASGNYVAYIPLHWGLNTPEGAYRGYFVLNDGTSDQSSLNAIQLTFCDEDKTDITGNFTQQAFNAYTLNIASTAKYIKLTMYNWFSYTIVKFGLCKSEYSVYTEETVSARLNSIETSMTALGETSEEHSNILDDISQPAYNGSYFDFSNYVGKGLFGTNSLFTVSGATFDIDISGLGLTGKYISTFLWKDDDTSYIDGYITENQLDSNGNQIYPTNGFHYVGHPVQILEGCTTIRLTATPNAYNNWGSAELTHAQLWTSGSEKLDFSISYKLNEANAWAGKKWVSYGDSITQLGTYQPFVANKIGLSVVNAGLGGSAVADGTDISVASFTDPTRISALPVDADVVTIMGGTNDLNMTNSGAGSPIGSLPTSATFDTTTFIGALCQTVKLIQNQCPNALIIICGNIGGRGNTGRVDGYQLANSRGLTCVDYAKAAKSVAEYMGIPYIPTDECGINPFNRLSYITDTVHPNTAGAELISRPIIAYFETNQPN